jgi:ABC-type Fe3+/spermidine/putrescine transport system ATPase subunit
MNQITTPISPSQGTTKEPRLALCQLSCTFGNHKAVENLDLDIMPGEFISLLGPSGCGKTTTLRMIAGFIKPDAGTIALDGQEISSSSSCLPPEKRQMSMIFQSYAIWPNMTIGENVAFGLQLRRLDKASIAAKVDEVLKAVHLSHLAERYPAELSGGQQQRVALARAVVVRPRVLLLDEPLSNLDANLREEMRFEIRRLHDAFDFTTVYVTHDQSEAMVTSDRIAVMNGGRIEQIDAPYQLYTRPKTQFVASFIGRTNLVPGVCDGDHVSFDGFNLPRGIFSAELPAHGPVTLSVRPQTLKMRRDVPDHPDACFIRARLRQRAFLGETWDYLVCPEGSQLQLRISAVPSDIFEVNDLVWVELDPSQMVPVT